MRQFNIDEIYSEKEAVIWTGQRGELRLSLVKEHSSFDEKSLWEPSRKSIEETNVKQFMDDLEIKTYSELVKKSTEDISWWWKTCEGVLRIKWSKRYSKIFDSSSGIENTVWFPGGELNAVDTVLDQKLMRKGNSKAFIWEGEDGSKKTLTYG